MPLKSFFTSDSISRESKLRENIWYDWKLCRNCKRNRWSLWIILFDLANLNRTSGKPATIQDGFPQVLVRLRKLRQRKFFTRRPWTRWIVLMRILILHISRAIDAGVRQFIPFRERSDKKKQRTRGNPYYVCRKELKHTRTECPLKWVPTAEPEKLLMREIAAMPAMPTMAAHIQCVAKSCRSTASN